MSKRPLKLRELLKKLKPYGIIVLSRKRGGQRGKGSEIILLKPVAPGSRQGPQYPTKNHGAGTEISIPVIDRIIDRFGIEPKDFWNDRPKKARKKK